jgi:uncharacterized membrane protein YuzA (DUF378 family)
MKASRWKTADFLACAVLSVGALSWSLLGLGRFDLLFNEPFGSLMVFSRAAYLLAAMAVLYKYRSSRAVSQPVPARVRR